MNPPFKLTETAAETLGLTKSQVILFRALSEMGGSITRARDTFTANVTNLSQGMRALQGCGLLKWDGDLTGVADLSPAEGTLRSLYEDELPKIDFGPEPEVTLRPLAHRLISIIRNAKTPVAGLGAVYCFLFGGELRREEWGTIAAYTKQPGYAEAAAVFFLEHIGDGLRNPLKELLPLFVSTRSPYRPPEAPIDAELQAQRWSLFEPGWLARLRANTPTEYDLALWNELGKPILDK